MRIDQIELRIVHLPYRSVFKTSFAAESAKTAVLVTVRSEGVEGYGEGVMDPLPHYREETIAGATGLMRDALAPDLFARGCEHPSELYDRWAHWRGNNMAKTAIELAVWDCYARQHDVPLRTLYGGDRTEIPVGASLGMNPVPETVASVERHVAEGYRRVKLKVMPGWDLEPLRAVRADHPDLALQVDANAGYTAAHLDLVASFDDFGLLMVEQPFAPEELRLHARLAARMATPICLDESILSTVHAATALDLGACTIVNIKVGRVGGVLEARRIHDLCLARGVPVWCGGMLETGIGRAANVALASLPGFTFPADLSASDRYWRRDLTEAFVLDGSCLRVPDGPGLGVSVDADALDELGAEVRAVAGVAR